MTQPNPEKPASRFLVFCTVMFYLVAAIAMIMANKWVLNKTTTPIFFLLTQLLIAVLLFIVCNAVGAMKLPLVPSWKICKGLAPVIVLNVLGLCFNNFTLKFVDASFYQVARGLVLPLTVLTSFIILHARPSLRILLSCSVVTAGFFIGVLLDRAHSSQTKSPSPIGIVFGFLSSLTSAVHATVVKRSLSIVDGRALELSWYSNLLSSLVMIPLVIVAGEAPEVMKLLLGEKLSTDGEGLSTLTTFLWGSLITGVVGFLIGIAGMLSIKITSPITHMISSAVRGVVQSLFGMWIFHDIITTDRASSIAIILLGSIYYTWVKNEEVVQKEQLANGQVALENGHGDRVPRGDGPAYERIPMEEVKTPVVADLDEEPR